MPVQISDTSTPEHERLENTVATNRGEVVGK